MAYAKFLNPYVVGFRTFKWISLLRLRIFMVFYVILHLRFLRDFLSPTRFGLQKISHPDANSCRFDPIFENVLEYRNGWKLERGSNTTYFFILYKKKVNFCENKPKFYEGLIPESEFDKEFIRLSKVTKLDAHHLNRSPWKSKIITSNLFKNISLTKLLWI